MAEKPTFDLAPFRNYLRLLAQVGLHPKLRQRVDASDVVQQTLLEAHQAIDRFEGDTFGQRAAWLRKILVRNLANLERDQGRKKRDVGREVSMERTLEHSSLRLAGWLAAEQSTPSEKAMCHERILVIADALESLPDLQREVIILRHCLGHSVDDIAAQTSQTAAAVAGQLRRGLRKLRERLSGRI